MSALELTMVFVLVAVILVKLALMAYTALWAAGSVLRVAPVPVRSNQGKARYRTPPD